MKHFVDSFVPKRMLLSELHSQLLEVVSVSDIDFRLLPFT